MGAAGRLWPVAPGCSLGDLLAVRSAKQVSQAVRGARAFVGPLVRLGGGFSGGLPARPSASLRPPMRLHWWASASALAATRSSPGGRRKARPHRGLHGWSSDSWRRTVALQRSHFSVVLSLPLFVSVCLDLVRSVFPWQFWGRFMDGDLIGLCSIRFASLCACFCVRGNTCGVLLCFCFSLLCHLWLYALGITGIYALGISGISPVGGSCVSRVFCSLLVSGKGVSQFVKRSVVALALCIARATSTVPDRRLGPVEIQLYCLFKLF